MACANPINYNSTNYDTSGTNTCIKPQEFDKMCDYSSSKPFQNLQGPPSNSKIKTYWSKGWVKAPLKNCALTFTQYVAWQAIPKGSQMITKRGSYREGDGYTGTGNGLLNPINISVGKVSKQYGGNSGKLMADKQYCAKFPDMLHGLAAAMHFYIESYHGQNVCQLNNRQQGFLENDEKKQHDCIGMAALRLRWVTEKCHKMGIKPNEQLNLKDKETLFLAVSAAASNENGLTFQRGFLERAYALCKVK